MSIPSLSLPRAPARPRAVSLPRPRPELLALLVLAAVLDLWALDRNGFANEYYSAAVRSMTDSWHAFVFGSFDTSGVMTVDKPPLSLWIQALSAKLFGFSSWSLLVPQALMGVGAVALTYDMVRRRFGRAAGFAGGLALALTPVTVAISRHNNPDALLVLCCVAALWFALRALEDGRMRWFLLAGVAVGLGFEAKMAAALMVVPGIVAAWLWVAPRGRAAAARGTAAFGAAAAVVGLAWPVLVWLTPASSRPWVSGTSDNSIWSLIFGYNGLGRLFGQDGGPGGGAGGGGGGVFGGEPGVLRLLGESLGGQAGWLLGVALAGGVALLALTRLRRADARTGWLLAVGGAALVTAVAFSRAEGIFHPYYVSQLAPFVAALVGAAVGLMVAGGRTARIVAPAAIAGGVVTELLVLAETDGLEWLPALLVVGGAAAAAALALQLAPRPRAAVVAAAIGLLLLAPASWSVQTLGHAASGTFPAGGPAATGFDGGGPMGAGGGRARGGANGFGGPPPGAGGQLGPGGSAQGGTTPGGTAGGGMFGGDSQELAAAVAYAEANGGGTIAVSSQSGAAGQLIASGADVAAIGGFSGRESEVSVEWLADAVEAGRIRYVLTSGDQGGMPQDGRVGATSVMAVAAAVGSPVDAVSGLYDLQGLAGALRGYAG